MLKAAWKMLQLVRYERRVELSRRLRNDLPQGSPRGKRWFGPCFILLVELFCLVSLDPHEPLVREHISHPQGTHLRHLQAAFP